MRSVVARAPLAMVAGRDRRPGDTFELDDAEAAAFVESGVCDYDGEPAADSPAAPAKPKSKGKKGE